MFRLLMWIYTSRLVRFTELFSSQSSLHIIWRVKCTLRHILSWHLTTSVLPYGLWGWPGAKYCISIQSVCRHQMSIQTVSNVFHLILLICHITGFCAEFFWNYLAVNTERHRNVKSGGSLFSSLRGFWAKVCAIHSPPVLLLLLLY